MSLDPISAILNIGGKVIDRVFPDPTQRAAAQLELIKLQQSGELAEMAAQTDINKVEAAHNNVFVSGWRPAIGWVCGAGCAWNWVLLPAAKLGLAIAGMTVALEPADLSEMMPLLLGMLGLGALRTVEKVNRVASK